MLIKNLRRGTRQPPEDFVPELMFLAVRPYLGNRVALEELGIPPPEPRLEPLAESA
jgi:hypothetical protein